MEIADLLGKKREMPVPYGISEDGENTIFRSASRVGSWVGGECKQQAHEGNGNSRLKENNGASRDATVKEQGLRLSKTGSRALEKLQQ